MGKMAVFFQQIVHRMAQRTQVVAYTIQIWYNAPLNNGKKKAHCSASTQIDGCMTPDMTHIIYIDRYTTTLYTTIINQIDNNQSLTWRYPVCSSLVYPCTLPIVFCICGICILEVPCAPIVRAFFMGITYHLGSLAFGAV